MNEPNKHIDTEDKAVVTRGEGEGGWNGIDCMVRDRNQSSIGERAVGYTEIQKYNAIHTKCV